ncbi:hypothetical protein [Modestobacter marinus]|uniref:hypothetical protein n=1 Tax=Modestobacter marinus TaxID=477641 RepID=UPI001C95808E|nr:hypothetical protein [Modestobacter marinus]
MSAPIDSLGARRPWVVGAAVAALVLAVVALAWALRPGGATAAASLTVTPRSADGADAALLLADRYTTLAGATDTLRAAQEREPALAAVPVGRLAEGTEVERSPAGATITVRVTLPDADAAAAAANAVVSALVETGADEELVDVDPGAEASAGRADTHPDRVPWTIGGLLLALVSGLAAAVVARATGRRGPGAPPPPTPTQEPAAVEPGAGGAFLHDDLPGFLENPPGSPPAAAPAPPVLVPATVPAPRPPESANGHRPTSGLLGRRAVGAAVVTSLVLSTVALAVAVGRDRSAAPAPAAAPFTPSGSATPEPDAPVATTAAPPTATGTAAGDLAFASVPLGEDGVAASVVFDGVLLEQRAVGLTVTYPAVSLSTDGEQALAHVRFPTFNCLTDEPPADPLTAGCARSITEYADLATPHLQVTREAGRIELVGLFPTYTRPNGTAPAYTGRAYRLTAAVSAEGAERNGQAPATGVVRLGLDSAPTATGRGVNLLQFPG